MDEKKYINPNNPVYISYAWENKDYPNLEDDVNALCQLLKDNNIFYKRDKENLCPYRWSLAEAEKEIGEGAAIIVVISDKYIKSLHCMHEWHQMRENGRIWERVFPVVLENTKLTDKAVYREYHKYFENRKKELIAQQDEGIIPLNEVESRAFKFDFFVSDLKDMYQYLSDFNRFFSKGNYDIIIGQLINHLQGIINKSNKPFVSPKPIESVKFTESVKPDVIAPSVAHFSLPAPDGLVRREKEENNLVNLLSQNRIVNLAGVGGSGKSSLTYLALNSHKDSYNEVIYVVVNNNIKDDIVELFNHHLKFEFRDGEDPFLKIISYLQENYKSEKPNLLVLDINETSDKKANATIVNGIIQNKNLLNGWKILILSRENIDTRNRIKIHSLSDKQDLDFLRVLFLDKAGTRYDEVIDLDEFLKVVYYNPLLVEQLGYYLKYYPKVLSAEEIKTKLYGSLFRKQAMKGISAQRHDETIISFLTKLIKFSELNSSEKELLRHFVLWQSDYISFDVIDDLLKGVFESDEQLVYALASLSERSILTINSGKILSYKLHGLLADSLRAQIDIPREDYSKYLSNIERIIQYDYYRFLPYVDCIVNSLCEYDIATDDSLSYYGLVNCVGKKLNDSWKYDYCQKVSEKNIRRIEEKRKQDDNSFLLDLLVSALMVNRYGLSAISNYQKAITILEQQPKESPEYQCRLANAYNILAILQIDHLGEYRLAEMNFKKVIDIYEMLSKEDPENQNDLAGAYYNLALLQEDYLGEYELAESNFKKALEIREKLPKENTEYQNDLASVYNNLAILQEDYLGEYELAESNFKKALEIHEKMPKENPEYQFGLAGVYNNIADLQKKYLAEHESAESNYKKAIEIFEQLPKENPKYQNDLATAYNNLAALQASYLKEYELAESNFKKALEIREKLPKEKIRYQIVLADAYNNLANLQRDHLGAYDSAETNYNKAIEIREKLPKEDPVNQNRLALAYTNLANLQQNHLGAYDSAETNYQDAIEILEKLPKENPEYQDSLALAYTNLASLQRDHLGAYDSAETNYNKAIEIREKLPKENPKYQNALANNYNMLAYCYDAQKRYTDAVAMVNQAIDIAKDLSEKVPTYLINWINYKHSLAEIVFNNNQIEKANEILDEIKPLAEKCLTEKPNDSFVRNVNNAIIQLLEKCANV